MPMTSANSWAGTPILRNGNSSFSNASVMSSVVVVSVSRLPDNNSNVRRTAVNAAREAPSWLMTSQPQSRYTSPPCTNSRLNSAVSTTMNESGAMERSACVKGMRESANSATTTSATKPSAQKLPALNMMTTRAMVPTSFVRASSRCTMLSAAQ